MNISTNAKLQDYSNFGLGGIASKIITLSTSDELINVLSSLEQNKEPYKIFAGGTNVVFPDEGLTETLIHIKGGNIEINNTDLGLTADSGVLLMDVVKKALRLGWVGMENLSGIPGTIGGAVYGNAGAYGTELKDLVDEVEIFDQGKRKWLSNTDCQFGYRTSVFKNHLRSDLKLIILKVKLKLAGRGDANELKNKSQEIIQIREQKYSPELKCPGSYFKNLLVSELTTEQLQSIPKDKIMFGKIPAGYLLEEVDAKSKSVGDIKVADFHANLLYNAGNGTAKQARELAEILKQLVLGKFGIRLEEEVRYF